MLTLKSKFSDYIEVLRKAGACEPVVAIHDDMVKKTPNLTVGEVYKTFSDDPNFNEGWAYWVLDLMGKELDVKIREIAINKIKDPMSCFKLLMKCDFLTTDERIILQGKYDDQNTDIAKALICLKAIQKRIDFNKARVEAYTTCASVSDAKTLLESKTGVATTISADSALKSPDAIKSTLESERTKVTIATNLVMQSQGFVDVNGVGSVGVFMDWYERLD
jgi:hypothetical protein